MPTLSTGITVAVENANVKKVWFVLDKHLKSRYSDACSCRRCICDMAALALNYLPPHYYVDRERGSTSGSPMIMIENAVIEAIEYVTEKPNHACFQERHLKVGKCG